MFKKVVYYLVVLIITFNQSTPLLGSSGLNAEQRTLNVASFDLVWTTVRDKHFDPELGGLDWDAIGEKYRPQIDAAESMRDVRVALTRMVEELGQSHFNILPRHIIEDIAGVGEIRFREGSLGLEVVAVDGKALVVTVQEDSSAEKAGVKTGWEILIAEGVETRPLLEEVRNEFEHSTYFEYYSSAVIQSYLEGEIGQSVQLTFLDGDNNKVEQILSMEKKTGWRLSIGNLPPVNVLFESRLLERNVGYIRFSLFMDPLHLMPAYNKAISSFMKADGVIIDLRGNGGGMAPIAMGMAGWFVPGKEHYLGTLHFRDSELKTIIYPRAKTYSGPVVFLVDGRSASCSELFSGGMKDLGRARIIGTTTAGAVLMSTFMKLPNGDALQYPFADYISRGGQALEGVGVEPHEIARHNQDDLLAGIDFPLTRAVAWITGQNNTKTIANEH
jgi:carboxyl-terminal processing protease